MTRRLSGTAELEALIPQVAAARDINPGYVEKDFWAMESLRALTAYCDGQSVPAIFKGGTSLSRGWDLTARFSEDIDIVLDFPDSLGTGARDRILKGIAPAVRHHLNLDEFSTREYDSTTGVKRTVEVQYPVEFASESTEIKDHVLLEVGSRGAPMPAHDRSLRSFVAEYLFDNELASEDEYMEIAPFTAHILAPERTLIEKLALLATLDQNFRQGNANVFAAKGRHLYDVHQLLGDSRVLAALDAMGSEGIAAVAEDVRARSDNGGWACVERPGHGWIGSSSCFVVNSAAAAGLQAAYASAQSMVYGQPPTFADCLERLQKFSGRL
jgi:hypothetical protein